MQGDPLHVAENLLDADLESADGGYQVVAVHDNASFDLAVGDLITAVNGTPIASVDWTTLVDPSNQTTVTLTVQRDGSEVSLDGQLVPFGRRGGFPGGFNGQPGGFPPGGQRGNGQPDNGQPGGNGQPGNGQPNGNGQPQSPSTGGAV